MTAEVSRISQQRDAFHWPFPPVRTIGHIVYVGTQVMPPASGNVPDIETQTSYVFESLIAALESQGMRMSDLKKLHTYYVYEGEGAEVTKYWERMTATRLTYLANPGPAATALRVRGLCPGGPLIGIDGIGDTSNPAQRIMPTHTWDWSIPTPFSQGWLVGDRVYCGGQISADMQGKAVDPGKVVPQTKNTLEYLRHVLLDAGASWDDVVSIKVAYKCTKNDQESRKLLQQILAEMHTLFPAARPALICVGVDLVYEGLLLEIDAMAVQGRPKKPVSPPGAGTWADAEVGYPPAWLAGNELYIGGQSAPGAASMAAQAASTMSRIGHILSEAGAGYGDLVKLNVYYCTDSVAAGSTEEPTIITQVLASFLQPGRTVVSMVEVPGLRHPGQRVQIDGLAVLGQQDGRMQSVGAHTVLA
jgi:enamine deaminase RidA (YjgF/YER057c/UK114 family)